MLGLLASLVISSLPATQASANVTCMSAAAEVGSGECDGTPLDLWYRASRLSDGPQRNDGSLWPARRTREVRTVTSCDVPRQPAVIVTGQSQPVALFALPGDVQSEHHQFVFWAEEETLQARVVAPLDRPPRA